MHVRPIALFDTNMNKCSAAAEMGDCARAKWAEKWGLLFSFPVGGELGPHLTQCGLGEVYLHTKWHLEPSTVWPQYINVTERQERTMVR